MMGHRTPLASERRRLGRYTITTVQTPAMYSFGGTPPPWCYLVEGFFHSDPKYTTTAYDQQRCEFIALNTDENVFEVVPEHITLDNLREGIYIVFAHSIQQWKLVAYNTMPSLQTIIVDSKAE